MVSISPSVCLCECKCVLRTHPQVMNGLEQVFLGFTPHFAAPLYSVLGFFSFLFLFFPFLPPLFFSLSSLLTSVVNRMASLSRAADKINRINRQKFLSTFLSPLVFFFPVGDGFRS